MKKKSVRMLCMALISAMTVTLLAGCEKKDDFVLTPAQPMEKPAVTAPKEPAAKQPEADVTEEPATVTEEEPVSETIEMDFATLEKITDEYVKIYPNGKLNDASTVSGIRFGDYADKMDEVFVTAGYKKMNRKVYYDLMATSFPDKEALEEELDDAALSFIIAFAAQMLSDNADAVLEYTDAYNGGSFTGFIYNIPENKISINDDGDMTWNDEPFDIAEQLLVVSDSLNKAINGMTPENTQEVQAQDASSTGLASSGIADTGVSLDDLSARLGAFYGANIRSVESYPEKGLWYIYMDNGAKVQVTYWNTGSSPSVTVCDASTYDQIVEYR